MYHQTIVNMVTVGICGAAKLVWSRGVTHRGHYNSIIG